MINDQERERSSQLQGQVLRRSERREVALFLLDDSLWVADFVDGQGEVVDAVTWMRFNSGAASAQARRRMALESAFPLSDELVARIEKLLRSDRAKPRARRGSGESDRSRTNKENGHE